MEESRNKQADKKMKYKMKQSKHRDKMIINAISAFGAMFAQVMSGNNNQAAVAVVPPPPP
jgi:hypothetical protein